MLTGRIAFAGDTVSDTIAAILERDPDFTALPSTTPPAITRLLQRCLAKDARRRLRDIGDARAELDLPAPDRQNESERNSAPRLHDGTSVDLARGGRAVCGLVVTGLWLTRRDTVRSGDPSQFTLSIEDQGGYQPG